MKNWFLMIAMIARHTVTKVLLAMAALIAGNCIVFQLVLDRGFQELSMEFDRGEMYYPFAAVFLLMTFFLCRALCDRGGQQNYFLDRLRISSNTLYFCHIAYNAVCYALLFLVQGLCLLGLAFWCRKEFPESFNQQSMFALCYKSTLLHTFFPMEDWLLALSNLVLILGLGICTAAFPTRNRWGRGSYTTFIMVLAVPVYLYMQSQSGYAVENRIAICVMAVFCIVSSLCGCLIREEDEDA